MSIWDSTKLLIMIVSAVVILSGLLCLYSPIVIAGAVIHLVFGIAELFQSYRYAKLLRSGTLQADSRSVVSRIAGRIDGTIFLTGLVLSVAGRASDDGGYLIAGFVISLGAIFCYFVLGIIAREIGGVPLSMGYGGWEVRRDRKGRMRK